MIRFKKPFIYLFIIFSFISLMLCGCIHNKNTAAPPNKTCKVFDSYTKKYFDSNVKSNGLNLHFLLSKDTDYTDVNMSLGDYSYNSMKAGQSFYINQINLLKKIDYNCLDASRQLTYDVLMDYLKSHLDYADLCLCTQDLSETCGVQTQLPIIFSEYEFYNETDIKNYLTLLKSVFPFYKQICEFQKLKAENNSFSGTASCDGVVHQCENFLNNNNLKRNLLNTSFHNRIDNVSFLNESQKQSYKNQNETIIKQNIFPAYQLIIDTMNSLKENGFCKNNNGLCYLKNGKDYYEYLVKNNTGSSLSVMEIKSMIQNQIVSDMKQLYSLISLYPELENNISKTQNLTDAGQILGDLEHKYTKDFSSVSPLKYSLKTVDESLRNASSPAFYIAPPLDNPDSNLVYINPKKTTDDLYTILAHEGIPGHLYQNAYFSSTKPDPVRHLLDFGGYSEGWAVYAELLSYHYQYDNEPLAKAMNYNASYSLALYCLCDIGVNYEGWTPKKLEHFLKNYNIEDAVFCKNIFNEVIENPANYLKYYVGYLEILKTKKNVMLKTGADFDLKKFHNALLTIGPAGFDVINKWIMYYYNLQ